MSNKKTLILGSISLVAVFAIIIYLIARNFILSMATPDIDLNDENFNGIDLNQNINRLKHDIQNPNIYYSTNGVRVITDENRTVNYWIGYTKLDKSYRG